MPTLLLVVAGAIAASFFWETNLVTAGALCWLVIRSLQHARQIEALKKALALAQARGTLASGGAEAATPEAAHAEAVASETDAAPITGLDAPLPTEPPVTPRQPGPRPAVLPAEVVPAEVVPAEVVPTVSPVPGPEAQPVVALQDGPVGSTPTDELHALLKRWLLGGNTIVKAGIAILFIGLAFLARYASEHVQVPVEFRLAGIAGFAVVLLALGWRLRHRRAGYAQVLQGGAVAVLYLTLFVAFRFYGVLAAGPVFGLMAVVAALAAALAVLQDARALAVIGALGGFATPLLVSSGGGSHVALFSYYLLLDLGIAAVAWYRTWRSLNLVGFAGTFLVGSGWGVLQYAPDHYASSQLFLVMFFLVFIAIMLMPARAGHPAQVGTPLAQRTDGWVNGSLLFGLPTITFALQYGLVRHTDHGVALSALAFAAFYVALAAWMRARPRLALVFEGSLAVGTVFLTLVIPFALDARSTAGAWALEGAGLVWLGWRQARKLPRVFGYLLSLLAGVSLLVGHDRFGAPAGFFNASAFNALMLAAAALVAAHATHRQRCQELAETSGWMPGEQAAEPLLIGWATLWLWVMAGLQIGTFVDAPFQPAAWLAWLSAVALAYIGLSVRLRWPTIALPVMGHAPLMALMVLATVPQGEGPLAHGGWWAWPLALAVHAVVLRSGAPAWPAQARHAVHAVGLLVVAALGALQGRAITGDWGDPASAWAWLGWLVVPAALLLALPREATARRWPVSAEPMAYQSTAALILSAGLLAWCFLANITSSGAAQPLPYLPLVNPLDLGVAAALLAVVQWLRSAGAAPLLGAHRGLATGVWCAAGFVWLNAMLIRVFQHHGGVPFTFDGWTRSFAVQTGLTLLWTVTAMVLMWGAARRTERAPWVVGAGLLGAVVLKLLLVDLAGSGTVTRIVSFIGVGMLMLVIGYVAPWPASNRKEVDHASD